MAKTAKAAAEKVNGKKVQQGHVSPPAPAAATVFRQEDAGASRGGGAETTKQAQSVEFPEATARDAAGSPNKLGSREAGSLDILLDMSVPVAVSIGRTEIPVRQLLQLGPGSVLKLDKPIDEPADLFLKDAKFAAGDVVVVDGRFAVRIRQIIGAETP